jgi:hypothetical protein
MKSFKSRPFLCLLLVPLLSIGCGGKAGGDPEVQRRTSELADIYEVYTTYTKRTGKPPKQLTDLTKMDGAVLFDVALGALREGRYVAVWGVSSRDASVVLAYEKDADKKGGAALTADGEVKQMSADELQAALKNKG